MGKLWDWHEKLEAGNVICSKRCSKILKFILTSLTVGKKWHVLQMYSQTATCSPDVLQFFSLSSKKENTVLLTENQKLTPMVRIVLIEWDQVSSIFRWIIMFICVSFQLVNFENGNKIWRSSTTSHRVWLASPALLQMKVRRTLY